MRKQRPNFVAVVSVVALMVLLALAATALRPLIPGPAPNQIAAYPGDYMKQAAGQSINWHPMDAGAFAEARRLDRPVLLFIGVAWSQQAREFDQQVLGDPDIDNYLSHNFVCVRVDGGEMPGWISAYLPVSRVTIGIRPRFQIWVLEPDGKLIGNIGRRLPSSHLDQAQFLTELERVKQIYTQMRQQNAGSDVEAQQAQDIARIETPGANPTLDFQDMASTIDSQCDRKDGGFPQFGYQDLHPYAWDYLAEIGRTGTLHDSLMPVLYSPDVDLLDGGFFVTSRSLNWRSAEFDKSAVQNAEMAWMLARVGGQLDPSSRAICEYLVRKTVGSLTGEFVDKNGFLRTARVGDEQPDGRSARASVSPQRMRDALNADQRDWSRRWLGLRVETNDTMTPFLAPGIDLAQADAVLTALRPGAQPATFTQGEFMNVNGEVAARLMEIGRATGDAKLIDFGSGLFAQLDKLRVADQVPHDLSISARSPATLNDYLSFSDAALEDYLTSGRVVSLQNGLAVLQRALLTFAGPNPGEFLVSLPPSSSLVPAAASSPQVVDDLGESTSAKVVRLCTCYGRLLLGDNSLSNPGLALLQTAFATARLVSDPAGSLGVSAAAFGCASLQLSDDEFAVCVGPQSQTLADALSALRPMRFVCAAFGPVRPDLRDRAAGIYIVRQGKPIGPLTLGAAAGQLSATLGVTG